MFALNFEAEEGHIWWLYLHSHKSKRKEKAFPLWCVMSIFWIFFLVLSIKAWIKATTTFKNWIFVRNIRTFWALLTISFSIENICSSREHITMYTFRCYLFGEIHFLPNDLRRNHKCSSFKGKHKRNLKRTEQETQKKIAGTWKLYQLNDLRRKMKEEKRWEEEVVIIRWRKRKEEGATNQCKAI